MKFTRLGQAAAVVLGSLAALAGCQQRNVFQPPPPPAVTIAQPQTGEVVDWVEFTGTTKATATVELRARVKGYLQKIKFEDGAVVKKDQLLFIIEKSPFEAELEAAEANVDKALAATQLAKANLKRTTTLVAERAVSAQQLDVDTAQLATAEANERAAAANVAQAKLNLGYTEIRAPIDGRIGRHLVDEGNLILADSSLLAIIESIDPIHAYFPVSERDLLRFMEMLRQHALPDPEKNPPELFLALGDEDDFPHRGVLDYRELGVDPGTGTTMRRGIFKNDRLQLLPGMFVRVRAALGKPQSRLMVEERALGADQRGDFVLVVDDKNKVEYRPVKLGISEDGKRVVLDGLQENEWIIVNGLQRARPGSTVTPEKLAQAEANGPQPSAAAEQTSQQPPAAAEPASPRPPAENSASK